MWTKELPSRDGWYLWRKTKAQKNPITWYAYYVCFDVDGIEFWENGTAVYEVKGGWWSDIPCGTPMDD